MPVTPLILCEKAPRWASAFRRELRKGPQQGEFRITEVRSLPQCERELEASPHAALAIEVTSQNLVPAVRALADYQSRFPHVRLIALADRGLAEHELTLREAGALHVALSPRSLAAPLRLIRRHVARAPAAEQTLEEAIRSRLPWG
jgi:hypothetical protein